MDFYDTTEEPPAEPFRGQSMYGTQLRLDITKPEDSALEICVADETFDETFTTCRQQLAALIVFYIPFAIANQFQWLVADVVVWGLVYHLIKRLVTMIHTETIVLASPLALQTTTVYAFGRSSRSLVPIANIHDIVINEVIVDIQVIYVLNILTKGESFRKTPVIPLMLTRPRLDMLERIYQEIQHVLKMHSNISCPDGLTRTS